MAGSHFLRMATLQGSGKLSSAARHNRRAFQNEAANINPALSHLNITLFGSPTPATILAQAKGMMQALDLTLRKNGVAAVEVLFSLPHHAPIDHRAYFTDCLAWAIRQFGIFTILSADIHLDEAAPHMHVLVLPLIAGRMRGRDLIGDRQTLQARQTSFYEEVSKRHGLSKPKRLHHQAKKTVSKAVLDTLRHDADPCMKSRAWGVIRDHIATEPERWAECLGVEVSASLDKQKPRSFRAIMTQKVKDDTKPSKPLQVAAPARARIETAHLKALETHQKTQTANSGFTPEKDKPLSCVAVSQNPTVEQSGNIASLDDNAAQ